MSKPRRTNTRAAVSSAVLRQISRQVQRMSDAEIYSLTFAGDRTIRRIAEETAHKRAEEFALSEEGGTW